MGRDQSKAADLSKALGGGATTGGMGHRPGRGHRHRGPVVRRCRGRSFAQYGDALAGKVIVDISNPFNSTFDGLAHREETSIAQEAAKAAPAKRQRGEGVQHHLRHVLEKGRPDVFIAGDNAQAKASVEAFIESLGLRPLDVGGLKMAHWAGRSGRWSRWASPTTGWGTWTSPSASPNFPSEQTVSPVSWDSEFSSRCRRSTPPAPGASGRAAHLDRRRQRGRDCAGSAAAPHRLARARSSICRTETAFFVREAETPGRRLPR